MKALCKGCEEADEGGALHQWIDPLLRWLRLHRRRRGFSPLRRLWWAEVPELARSEASGAWIHRLLPLLDFLSYPLFLLALASRLSADLPPFVFLCDLGGKLNFQISG